MSRPIDFDSVLADWLADDGPSEVPARVAEGAIAQVRALAPVGAGAPSQDRPNVRPMRPMRLLALAATLVLLGATVAIAFALLRPSPAPTPPSVVLPANGLIVASEDGDIILIDPTTGEKTVLPENLGDDTVTTVSPDGQTIGWWSKDELENTWSLMVGDLGPDGVSHGADFFHPVDQPGVVAWAPGSNLLAIVAADGAKGHLTIIDRHGGSFEDFPDLDAYGVTWRPDGKALAVQVRGEDGAELVLVPYTGGDPVVLARGGPSQVPGGEMFQLWNPQWSPDGRFIAYLSSTPDRVDADGTWKTRPFVMNADGTEPRMLELSGDPVDQGILRWSGDSRSLLVRAHGEDSQTFGIVPVDGSPGRTVLELPGRSWHVAWSPDETKIVAAREHEPAFIVDLATGERTPQTWMSAYDLSWQPIPPAPVE